MLTTPGSLPRINEKALRRFAQQDGRGGMKDRVNLCEIAQDSEWLSWRPFCRQGTWPDTKIAVNPIGDIEQIEAPQIRRTRYRATA